MIQVYTDGAAKDNPGKGGWAAIIIEDGVRRDLSGREERTTNNRMEIVAAIEGLAALPESTRVTVFSDSTYVINAMTKNWKRNANKDLWPKLDAEVARRKVQWRWVKGHDGNPLNEEADRLAKLEAGIIKTSPAGGSLTHIDESGKARMVDVGEKAETQRIAVAKGSVVMKPETLALIKSNSVEKGDVLGIARVAGIMAAKSTSQLIPLCHPIPINQVTVDLDTDDQSNSVNIRATARTTAKTGVEMEALTAVAVAALTIYDMCKAVDRAMRIEGIRLVRKSGGRSGDIVLEEDSDGG